MKDLKISNKNLNLKQQNTIYLHSWQAQTCSRPSNNASSLFVSLVLFLIAQLDCHSEVIDEFVVPVLHGAIHSIFK